MAGFNDWIYFEPAPMPALDHVGEFNEMVRERLGNEMGQRLRGSLDPGIDPKKAMAIAGLKVKHEGDTYIIKTDDSADALAFGESSVRDGREGPEASSIESLFETSSGVPVVRDGKMVFKTVSLETMFGAQKQRAQNEQVEHIIKDVLQNTIPDAYTEAFAKVASRHPAQK